MDKSVNIVSFNANGLGEKKKRIAVFDRLKKKNSIIFLQETHCNSEKERLWREEWGCNILFSNGTSNSTGVAILFPINLEIDIIEEFKDSNGRIIGCKVCIESENYVLVNVYAPTRDHRRQQLQFLDILTDYIAKYENESLIMGGDYNLYIDIDLDRSETISTAGDNPEYRNRLLSLNETLNIIDIWRLLNPDVRRYTWHSRGKASRLDYIFISDNLINNVHKCDIAPGVHSDHSLLSLSIGNDNDLTRGRGLWKFNCTLLKDATYVSSVKSIIVDCRERYKDLNNSLKWEMTKHDVRSFTKPYSVGKKQEINQTKNNLEDKLKELCRKIDSNTTDNDTISEYSNTKHELEEIEKLEASSSIFRSKIKWAEEGERNSKFFLNLEKRNYTNKLITQLQINDSLITDQKQILLEERNFYKTLYSEKLDTGSENYQNSLSEFMHCDIPKLSSELKQDCEKEITEKELLNSLKELKNGKTPGTDGFPPEFYKFFWIDIKDILLDSIHYAFTDGQLSIEQRRGVITLIPKKLKNRLFLKNWRPISLLNTDYKLIAKTLASRIKKVLNTIIDEDQTGYIKGRFIGQNIRIIEDVVYFCEQENKPGIILTVDYEKAFDSLNWNFMFKSLEKFNFGNNFVHWIKTLYNCTEAAVTNNGHISEFFLLQRGIRQGCPISAYLFIIAIELLAHHIRSDNDIKGIKVFDKEIKLSQLADDTTCVLSDLNSLETILNTFTKFSLCAGLKINLDKTKAKYIGSLKDSDYYPHGLSWIKGPIETLGVVCTKTENEHYSANFKPRIEKLKNTLQVWKQRNLSLKGKVAIVNSLALSPLVYISSVTHTPDKAITEIQDIISHFFWNGKRPKIAKDVLIQRPENGGIKLCNFELKVQALELAWISRIATGKQSKWTSVIRYFLNCKDIQFYLSCKYDSKVITDSIPLFYKNMLKRWFKLSSIEPLHAQHVQNELIWNNKFITCNRKVMYWETWINRGITKIRDLLNEDGSFLDHKEISMKYNVKCSFLDILQIRHSIPRTWLHILYKCNKIYPDCQGPGLIINNVYKSIMNMKCKDFYWLLVDRIDSKPSCITKWAEVFPSFVDVEPEIWERIFTMAFSVVSEPKIQSFQYRLIHRIIPCNEWLYNIKVKDTNVCDYCNAKDDILHYFLYCDKIHTFWVSLLRWWNRISDTIINDESELAECILFGFPGNNDITNVLNYIIVQAKYHIYIQRLCQNNNVEFYDFLIVLKHKLKVKKYGLEYKNNIVAFEPFEHIYNAL